jgi:hypothetical protein
MTAADVAAAVVEKEGQVVRVPAAIAEVAGQEEGDKT